MRSSPRPPRNGTSPSSCSSDSGIAVSRRSNRGDLLGDVDADRAPRDATPTADAARRPELLVPRPELVREPLAVPGATRRAEAATVHVRVVDREAAVPD